MSAVDTYLDKIDGYVDPFGVVDVGNLFETRLPEAYSFLLKIEQGFDSAAQLYQYVQQIGDLIRTGGAGLSSYDIISFVQDLQNLWVAFIVRRFREIKDGNSIRQWQARRRMIERVDGRGPTAWIRSTEKLETYRRERILQPDRYPAAWSPDAGAEALTKVPCLQWVLANPAWIEAGVTGHDCASPGFGSNEEGGQTGACHGYLSIFPLLFPIWRERALPTAPGNRPTMIPRWGDGADPNAILATMQAKLFVNPADNLRADGRVAAKLWEHFKKFWDLAVVGKSDRPGCTRDWRKPPPSQSVRFAYYTTDPKPGAENVHETTIRAKPPAASEIDATRPEFYYNTDGTIGSTKGDEWLDAAGVYVNVWSPGFVSCRSYNAIWAAISAFFSARTAFLKSVPTMKALTDDEARASFEPDVRAAIAVARGGIRGPGGISSGARPVSTDKASALPWLVGGGLAVGGLAWYLRSQAR